MHLSISFSIDSQWNCERHGNKERNYRNIKSYDNEHVSRVSGHTRIRAHAHCARSRELMFSNFKTTKLIDCATQTCASSHSSCVWLSFWHRNETKIMNEVQVIFISRRFFSRSLLVWKLTHMPKQKYNMQQIITTIFLLKKKFSHRPNCQLNWRWWYFFLLDLLRRRNEWTKKM